MTFIDVWIIYAICGVTVFSAVFVWAVRAGQFTDFDRARYIALDSVKVNLDEERPVSSLSMDKIVWLIVALITLALMGSSVWIGYYPG